MTMQPRTSEGSANSAARTTCWYHSGKSSSRRGEIAVFGLCEVAIVKISVSQKRPTIVGRLLQPPRGVFLRRDDFGKKEAVVDVNQSHSG
jgi:hypothetical protein